MLGGRRALTAMACAWLVATIALAACGGAGSTDAVTSTAVPSSNPSDHVAPVPTTLATTTTTSTSSTTTSTTTTTTTTTLALTALSPGDESTLVARLQTELTDAGFFRSEVDGVFGPRTAAAVMAFHKYNDVERTSTWQVEDWETITDLPTARFPERESEPDRIELDLTRQIGFVIFDGELEAILPISSGNGEYYTSSNGQQARARTPRGDFTFYKHYDGWRISYLGGLYEPWYFRGGYAIHGSNSVPAYPASHGCVRIPNWDADWLTQQVWIGLPVHIWD